MLQQPRTDQIRLRVSPAEKARIRERAEASGLGVSEYVRRQALGEVEVEAVESPVGKVSPPTSTATPEPGAESEAEFMARRTRELYGRGQTNRVASATAAAEWRKRS